MDASLIWYRARSEGELVVRLGELLDSLGAKIKEENTTINPTIVPALLAEALKSSDMTVIIGGMEVRREEENIITILSRCLALRLETDEMSRSRFIYDTLRGRTLPTFESAVLFPSANGGPEGMMLRSGGKIILLLPWMERRHMDILTMMREYLPQLLGLIEEEPEQDSDVAKADADTGSGIPYYIERAAAKHRAPKVTPNEELNAAQLRLRLTKDIKYTEASESNRYDVSDNTHNAQHRKHRSTAESVPEGVYLPSSVRYARKRRGQTLAFRVLSVLLLLAIIAASCYIAYYHYEPVAMDNDIPYQSELAELYSDSGSSDILPSLALPEFAQLYEKNPDTRGYLYIPGTDISLPIVQSADGDIDKYSGLDFYGNADTRGTLYFDASNNISFGADNSNLIVYGNSPIDGSMFTQLRNYTDADFLAEHTVINMDTLYEQAQWLIFSVCIVSQNTVSEFNYANTVFAGQNARETHLHNLYIRSLFYTETQVFPTDDILTLVADHDEFTGAKLLVCARKLRPDEDSPSRKSSVIVNELVLMPDIWYEINEQEVPTTAGLEFATTRENITAPNLTDENGDKIYVYESTVATTSTTMATTTSTGGSTSGGGSASSTTTTAAPATSPTVLPPATILPDMRITSGGKVITGPAAEVLAMIIEAEMGSDYNIEALKAQAVAAYTYYLYSGGSAKAPNFPTKTAGDRALEAAAAVAGQYMTFKGNVPYTPYYAVSAGHSANNADINGAELSYLTSVDCSVDMNVSGYCVVKEISALEVASRVREKRDIDLTAIADKEQWFQILKRDANDLYVTEVSVGGTVFKGNTLHLSILGYTCLRSPCFTIEYEAESDKFIFTSYGYGTGVGMSQTGANEYAKQGYDYIWILKHFYTGIELSVK